MQGVFYLVEELLVSQGPYSMQLVMKWQISPQWLVVAALNLLLNYFTCLVIFFMTQNVLVLKIMQEEL